MADSEAPAPQRSRTRAWWVLIGLAFSWPVLRLLLSPAVPPAVVCDRDLVPDDDTVVMLSASWCRYCRRARAYLTEKQVAYCEYDVETSAEGRRQYAAMPVQLVPVLRIKGDTLLGYNRAEIDQALIAHGLADFDD